MDNIVKTDSETRTKGQLLAEKLLFKPQNSYEQASEETVEKAYRFAGEYAQFLDYAKTERLAVKYAVGLCELNGIRSYEKGKVYQPGEKFYLLNRGKNIAVGVMGKRPLSDGVLIAAAHIDSPRLDLKQNPLYEDADLAFLKTHYYGGIKKYQWTAIPLALHGIVFRQDGSSVEISIGDAPGDPVFCVTDLLPHLGSAQLAKPMKDAIPGENLNILVGSRPFCDDKVSEKIKLKIMALLYNRYRITEQDFRSAELELVPAFSCRDVGLDASMLGAYGHDDRCCAYPALQAALTATNPEYTCITVLADKEETGSDGNTGMQSKFFSYLIEDLAQSAGVSYRDVFSASMCLSADVSAAYDPNYPDVMEKKNSAFVNFGVALCKYTGARGKADTSDASAEFVSHIGRMLDRAGVVWQTGELGKVDAGGGGTVAKYLANLNIDVLDIGVPVLSMHSPFEIISKMDLYMAFEAFCAFFRQK